MGESGRHQLELESSETIGMLSGLLTVYVGSLVILVCELWRTRDAAVVVSLRHQRALYAIGVALFLSHTVLSMKPSLWP